MSHLNRAAGRQPARRRRYDPRPGARTPHCSISDRIPTITRAKAEEDRKAKRKAEAKTKKNTKRQRTVAIQTRWRLSAP